MTSPIARRNAPRQPEEWSCTLTWADEAEDMDFTMPYNATWVQAVAEAERLAAEGYLPGATVRNVYRRSLR